MPIGLAHAGANRNDHQLLKGTLDSPPMERSEPTRQRLEGLCLNKADNKETRKLAGTGGFTPHIRSRGEEIKDKLRFPRFPARRSPGRSLPLPAEPQARPARPLVQEGREPPGLSDARERPHRLQEGPGCDPGSGPGSGLTG
ncbi:MAG: hypothetical protein Kow00122_11400 [Thermoleophilia bacterium]